MHDYAPEIGGLVGYRRWQIERPGIGLAGRDRSRAGQPAQQSQAHLPGTMIPYPNGIGSHASPGPGPATGLSRATAYRHEPST